MCELLVCKFIQLWCLNQSHTHLSHSLTGGPSRQMWASPTSGLEWATKKTSWSLTCIVTFSRGRASLSTLRGSGLSMRSRDRRPLPRTGRADYSLIWFELTAASLDTIITSVSSLFQASNSGRFGGLLGQRNPQDQHSFPEGQTHTGLWQRLESQNWL